MKVTKTPFQGLLIIEPRVFEDDRGYFYESYNKKSFQAVGIDLEFVQDNQSYSKKDVLRGLHFQKPPFAQSKFVRVLSGMIQDVAVDLRKEQPTFGKSFSIELSLENGKQLLIPKGFAHGFLVLSQSADVLYKCDEYYHAEAEDGIRYDDPSVNISWQLEQRTPLLSSKDLSLPLLASVNVLF